MEQFGKIYAEDLKNILSDTAIAWRELEGKTVAVSGATGLLGRTLVDTLIAYGKTVADPPQVVVLVRNREMAAEMFGTDCQIVFWDASAVPTAEGGVDYIFHCASQTDSRGFVEQPVQTIATACRGTEQLLRLAKEKGSRFVYLSSMEVYGAPQTDEPLDESYVGSVDPLKVRSCYPESKRLCENLCICYGAQYDVPVCIARLCQTFGPGIKPEDRRLGAQIARCVQEKKNVILHTDGSSKNNYLYVSDAVRALLLLALRGQPGQAYNIANDQIYCSIYEMAATVMAALTDGEAGVQIQIPENAAALGYAPIKQINLDVQKLRALGWTPQVGLVEMFRRMSAPQ